ncbi:MAG: hypothetical protein ACOY3M_04590 [Patescibacteria group bacterium]
MKKIRSFAASLSVPQRIGVFGRHIGNHCSAFSSWFLGRSPQNQ